VSIEPVIHVLGKDGLVHEAIVKWSADLCACKFQTAMRRIGERELQLRHWQEHLCPACFGARGGVEPQ